MKDHILEHGEGCFSCKYAEIDFRLAWCQCSKTKSVLQEAWGHDYSLRSGSKCLFYECKFSCNPFKYEFSDIRISDKVSNNRDEYTGIYAIAKHPQDTVDICINVMKE